MQGAWGPLIKALVQMGARVSEFVNVTADEVFFEEQVILMSKAKGGEKVGTFLSCLSFPKS